MTSVSSLLVTVTVLGTSAASYHAQILVQVRQQMPDIVLTPLYDLALLGSSLGGGALAESLTRCTGKVNLICQRIKHLDAHWAVFFLTRYASATRVNYVLTPQDIACVRASVGPQ